MPSPRQLDSADKSASGPGFFMLRIGHLRMKCRSLERACFAQGLMRKGRPAFRVRRLNHDLAKFNALSGRRQTDDVLSSLFIFDNWFLGYPY